jgi:hypothetical protein
MNNLEEKAQDTQDLWAEIKISPINPLLSSVIDTAVKPPLGLTPEKFHNEIVKTARFNEVCGAISRYYNAGLEINIEWIEEYNDLIRFFNKHSE